MPEPPSTSIVTHYLLENPWPLAIILLAIAAFMAWTGFREGLPQRQKTAGVLAAAAVVADIVYAPLVTPLLAAAGARGLRTVDGLGMLLHQAAGAFVRFFGMRPQVTQGLRTLVEADLIRQL